MTRPKRLGLRLLLCTATALWVILWPHNYGVDAHHWYWRALALLALVARAMFVGWAAMFVAVRPLLALRTADDQRPYPSIPATYRTLRRLKVSDPVDRTG